MNLEHTTESSSPGAIIRQIEAGLPYKALTSFVDESGINLPTVSTIVGIPERTLARRKTKGRLAPDESERLVRITLLFEKTVELFEGDTAAASEWLMRPQHVLGDASPLALAKTEIGGRMVEDLIGRLEHGVFS